MSPLDTAVNPAAGCLTVDDRATLATAHMQRGLALMTQPEDSAASVTALAHFDVALEIRRALPLAGADAAYALAASWMNRAEALLAIGSAANLALAVESLDAAVQLLEPFALDQECAADTRPETSISNSTSDARLRRRLSIALQNRALARGRARRDTWTMVPDLFRAIDLLAPIATDDDARLVATAWTNIGVAQLLEPTEDAWRGAMASAREALRVLGTSEQREVQTANIGLHARHLVCRAAARCLDAAGRRDVTEDVHAATDAVEDALVLVSMWEAKGVTAFRALAAELVEFGRRVYAGYQPHFVDEFEREHAAASGLLLGVR